MRFNNCPYCPPETSTSAACECVCHGRGLTQGHFIPTIDKPKARVCPNCGFIITLDNPFCGCHLFAKEMKDKKSITWKQFWNNYWKHNKKN